MDDLIGIVLLIVMVSIALAVGPGRRRLHAAALARREQALAHILITNSRRFSRAVPHPDIAPQLLNVELVWGVDRFQALVASIVLLFGGELNNVSAVILKVRREAIVRLKEQARRRGYNALTNLRIDPADIGTDPQRANLTIALVASATAYHRAKDPLA